MWISGQEVATDGFHIHEATRGDEEDSTEATENQLLEFREAFNRLTGKSRKTMSRKPKAEFEKLGKDLLKAMKI